MQPQAFGKYLLGDIMAKTSLGELVKAIPQEGPPQLVLLQKLPGEIHQTQEAKALVLKQAKQWMGVRELHTLNLLDAGEASGQLYCVCEYEQGKLLSDVLERCHQESVPLSADQAVYLAVRIVGALESLAGQKVVLGCLSPERVLVTFEGEVKVLPGVLKDLQTTPVLASPVLDFYRRYLPPSQFPGKISKSSTDRYAAGALLFEFLTHSPLCPPGGSADPAARLEEAARGTGGMEPLQGNLLDILRKSLLIDSPEAYPDLAAMRADLDRLITSGEYSPTTFNIAFLMHTLFRGEDEALTEADRQFLAVDRSAFQPAAPAPPPPRPTATPAPPPPAAAAQSAPEETPSFGMEEEPSRKPLWIGAGVLALVAVLGTLAWFAFLRPRGPSQAELQAQEELKRLQAQQAEMAQKMKSLEEERNQLASQVTNAKTEEERKKAQRALDETQRRLQAQAEEQKRLAAAAPAPEKKPPAPVPLAQGQPPAQPPQAAAAGAAAGAGAPSVPADKAPQSSQPPAPAEAAPQEQAAASAATKAGDFVELWAVDVKPKQLGDLKIEATPMARQNHLSGTIWVEVQINETGAVTSASVVKGPSLDYGMNATCVEAAKGLRYSPAMKDGVPVKTKLTFPVVIKGS
jgi:TonB family protein